MPIYNSSYIRYSKCIMVYMKNVVTSLSNGFFGKFDMMNVLVFFLSFMLNAEEKHKSKK